MSVKVFAVTSTSAVPVQVGGNWFGIDDAASDIRGGDFWSELGKALPQGGQLVEIRIVPDTPISFDPEDSD